MSFPSWSSLGLARKRLVQIYTRDNFKSEILQRTTRDRVWRCRNLPVMRQVRTEEKQAHLGQEAESERPGIKTGQERTPKHFKRVTDYHWVYTVNYTTSLIVHLIDISPIVCFFTTAQHKSTCQIIPRTPWSWCSTRERRTVCNGQCTRWRVLCCGDPWPRGTIQYVCRAFPANHANTSEL